MNRRHFSLLTAAGIAASSLAATGTATASASASALPSATITVTNRTSGVFDGIGAISGGGGNSRLLADYAPAVRNHIYDYLFRPNYGAALQMLKLEIGAGVNTSDGAEPSVEPAPGQVNCNAGYEWQIAEAAVARNPAIKLYALQWSAPGWVGTDLWTAADVSYVITWLKCASQHHLRISYIGGWDEKGPGLAAGRDWLLKLRKALQANGFGYVQYVAADSFLWSQSGTQLSQMLRTMPAYRKAVSVLGYHDNCRRHCRGPANSFGKPVWQSEVGALTASTGGSDLAHAINQSWLTAHTSGILEWPAVTAIPPDTPYQDSGLVYADRPWSGFYHVTPLTWVTAHTTQFTRPGWDYAWHGSRQLPAVGSVVTYEHGDDWSAVADTTSALRSQRLTLKISRPMKSATVHVWASDLSHKRYFYRLADRHGSSVTLTLRPGFLYTLTSTTGQGHGTAKPAGAQVSAPLPYSAAKDPADLPTLLAPLQGSFSYDPSGQVFNQDLDRQPILWHKPKATWNHPYAITGSDSWADYTIGTDVMFSGPGQAAGVLGRCHWPSNLRPESPGAPAMTCYQLTASADGTWQLAWLTPGATVQTLASGTYPAPPAGTWTNVKLTMTGHSLTAFVAGTQVTSSPVSDSSLSAGPAGITDSTWSKVSYRSLTVR